jgi:hypothetical protein
VEQQKGEIEQRKAEMEQRKGEIEQRKGEIERRKAEIERRSGGIGRREGKITRASALAAQPKALAKRRRIAQTKTPARGNPGVKWGTIDPRERRGWQSHRTGWLQREAGHRPPHPPRDRRGGDHATRVQVDIRRAAVSRTARKGPPRPLSGMT